MDNDTKNFFEKLAGIKSESDTEKEIEEELEEVAFEEISDESDGELAIDVYNTPNALVIESAIAGVNPDDIDISISPDSVSIKGKREKEEKVKTENYIHQECYWGRFSRTIILPEEIDADKAQANIKNGVLKITLPKLNKSRAKKVKVKFE